MDQFAWSDFPGNGLGFGFLGLFGAFLMVSLYSYFIWTYNRIPSKLLLKNLEQKNSALNWDSGFLYLFGGSLLIAPGFMLSIQPLWWNKANLIHSYLGILISEFGFVVIVATLLDGYLTAREEKRMIGFQRKISR